MICEYFDYRKQKRELGSESVKRFPLTNLKIHYWHFWQSNRMGWIHKTCVVVVVDSWQ